MSEFFARLSKLWVADHSLLLHPAAGWSVRLLQSVNQIVEGAAWVCREEVRLPMWISTAIASPFDRLTYHIGGVPFPL